MVKPEGPPGPAVDEPRDLAAHDDAALLERYVGTRDPQAFAELAARHGPLVFRTCLRALGNVHDAEDATQAVFLVLARRPHKARGCPAGWLHKVARDTALTLLRSRARRARREEEAAMRNAAPPARTPTASARNSTRRSAGCRRTCASRSSSATWKAGARTRRPGCSAATRGRCRGGRPTASSDCGACWRGAAWS